MSTLCSQCGIKPALFILSGSPLCLDCYSKFQEINLQTINSLMAECNYLTEYMEFATGLSGMLPRYNIPAPAPKHTPLTFNNITVDRSVVGAINTANVRQIDVSLNSIKNAGNTEAVDAIKNFTEAVLTEKDINNEIKNEIIELISYLTNQSLLKKENKKPAVIKSVLCQIEKLISNISSLVILWQKVVSLLGL